MRYEIKSTYQAATIHTCEIEAINEMEAIHLFYLSHGFTYKVLSVTQIENSKAKLNN